MERNHSLCACVSAASSVNIPEVAVLSCIIGSFDSCATVARLVREVVYRSCALQVRVYVGHTLINPTDAAN